MTTTVKLPPELEQSLRQRCAAEGRSISDVMRDALLAYLASAPAGTAAALVVVGLLGFRRRDVGLLTAGRHLVAANMDIGGEQLLQGAQVDVTCPEQAKNHLGRDFHVGGDHRSAP